MNENSLINTYRPTKLDELVLPTHHGLSRALQFVASPYPSAWLLHGRSGLGKTSLANLMALAAAGGERLNVQRYVGPDLDSNQVHELAISSAHRSVFGGGLNAFIVDESDAIPEGGQVRLLSLLDSLETSAWIFTSNEKLDSFQDRFLSRVKPMLFTAMGLFPPATAWLQNIALKEGIPLTRPGAEKLLRDAKNNLRSALQALELLRPTNQEWKSSQSNAQITPKSAIQGHSAVINPVAGGSK